MPSGEIVNAVEVGGDRGCEVVCPSLGDASMDCEGMGLKLGDASTGLDAVGVELGEAGTELESAELDEDAGVSDGEGVGD
jgi:hypothetical protein